MQKLIALIRLGRPLFLGGGFLMFALGAAVAVASGHAIDVRLYALGQAAVTAFQLMTHYANEYYDVEADRANRTPTQWSGGSRVLVEGVLSPASALVAAVVLAVIGGVLAVVLAIASNGVVAATLAAVFVLAWTYSAPPLRLCARGLGELDTAIVVTGLVPWLGFYLQAPDLRGIAWLGESIVPLVLLQIAMLLAIEFPDAAGDAATGKRTLVVRMGGPPAAGLYATLVGAAFVWLPLAVLGGLPAHVALVAALPAPIAGWRIACRGEHADPTAYGRFATLGVLLLVATSTTTLLGWLTR